MCNRAVAAILAALACGCTRPTSTIDDVASKYPDLRTLWSRSVSRTCGPNSGVCHNNRQFPDLQTAGGLLSTVNARCNQIRDNPASIDDLCEPRGDLFQLGSFSSRIGTVQAAPSAAAPATLTLTLHDPLPEDAGGAPAIVRESPGLATVVLPIPAEALAPVTPGATSVTLSWEPLSDPARAAAPAGSLATFLFPARHLPGDNTQVQLGDPNGDGVFGADLDGALVKPGRPLQSYLFQRLLGPLASGAQMPIGNAQYWDGRNAVTALWCWISGMEPDGGNADGAIDYARCDSSAMPAPAHQSGEATTFSTVYSNILQPSCAGCHHGGTSFPTTFYLDGAQKSYDTLIGIQEQGPSETSAMPYVTASDPTRSYLFLKISGDPSIVGARMPLDGSLDPSQLDALQTWILQGAEDN